MSVDTIYSQFGEMFTHNTKRYRGCLCNLVKNIHVEWSTRTPTNVIEIDSIHVHMLTLIQTIRTFIESHSCFVCVCARSKKKEEGNDKTTNVLNFNFINAMTHHDFHENYRRTNQSIQHCLETLHQKRV